MIVYSEHADMYRNISLDISIAMEPKRKKTAQPLSTNNNNNNHKCFLNTNLSWLDAISNRTTKNHSSEPSLMINTKETGRRNSGSNH